MRSGTRGERATATSIIAEVKMTEGKRDVDLSDGKCYGTDWVLLTKTSAPKASSKKPKKRKTVTTQSATASSKKPASKKQKPSTS